MAAAAPMRAALVALWWSWVVTSTFAFVAPQRMAATSQATSPTRVAGFFEDMMDKLEGKDKKEDEEWKEQMFKEQQEILKRRRKSGGFITPEQEKEIAARRASYSQESSELLKLQKSNTNDDIFDAWKKARDSGKFRTATKGLERDAKSQRLGSAGLFAERVDERLPYIDRGYVAKKDTKKKQEPEKPSPNDFFDGLKSIFDKK